MSKQQTIEEKIKETILQPTLAGKPAMSEFMGGQLARQLSQLFEAECQKENWIDAPDKAGTYWLSPFCNSCYISPHIREVIDYGRPERGLEVRDSISNTIPVKLFVEEYYPKGKWFYVAEPKWQALK